MTGRSWWRLAPPLVVVILVVGAAVERGNGFDSADAASVTSIATDAFSRTDASGLGSADVGGPYRTSSNAGSFRPTVGGGAALLPIAPGKHGEIWLPDAVGDHADMRVQFRVPELPAAGSGMYLGIDLRKQADGDTTRVRVRLDPRGIAHLGFTRVRNDVEVSLGRERTVPGRVAAGQALVLEGRVGGGVDVSLIARLYQPGAAVPDWQAGVVDTDDQRISTRGGVGVWAYLTRRATDSTTIAVDALDAFEVSGDDGDNDVPTLPPVGTTTAPAPPPTSSQAPSSQPPTSSSPTTSPTTTPPTTTRPPTSTPPTPPPHDGGSAGSLTPGAAAYPVPSSGAVFVAPDGNDSADGDQTSPLRTVARAIERAPSGSTIVLRGGAYHESVKLPADKTLTVQAYPHEAVWFDGTSPVSDWRTAGAAWVHDGWTAQFDHSASFTRGRTAGFVNPAHPMAAHPDQAWVGGHRLAQVGSADAVKPGTFYVDEGANRLYVGNDPGAGVRASTLGIAIDVRSAGSRLRGFGVRGYATSVPDLGSVRLGGRGDQVENLVVTTSATTGLAALITDLTIRHVTVTDNGLLGLLGNQADRLLVQGMRAERNNSEQFNTAPVAGGAKITRSRDITVDDGVFADNLATGLWIDESCYDVTITGNQLADNLKHGLSWEIGALGLIADNTVVGNGRDGMKINDVAHVRLWNNTFSDNEYEIVVAQDSRRASNLSTPGHDPRQPRPDPTVTWVVSDIDIHNNLVEEPGAYALWVADGSHERSATQMDVVVGGNAFIPSSSPHPFLWGQASGNADLFTTIAAFESAAAGLVQGNGISTSDASPLALPADIAKAIDRPGGTRHVGAF